MGFGSAFSKKAKMQKLIGNYVKRRIKERTAFNQQIKWLDTQLNDKQIDQDTYERFRQILEIKDLEKQQEGWSKIQNKFRNPLNS
jgi:transposase